MQSVPVPDPVSVPVLVSVPVPAPVPDMNDRRNMAASTGKPRFWGPPAVSGLRSSGGPGTL